MLHRHHGNSSSAGKPHTVISQSYTVRFIILRCVSSAKQTKKKPRKGLSRFSQRINFVLSQKNKTQIRFTNFLLICLFVRLMPLAL